MTRRGAGGTIKPDLIVGLGAGGDGVQPYPIYKESGSLLLGTVPMHWSVIHIKRFARLAYGDTLAAEVRADGGDIFVYGSNGPVGTHDAANTKAPALIIGRKGSHGAVNWSDGPVFAIDTAYFVDHTVATCNLRWLFWAFQAANLAGFSQDTGVPGLARESVHATPFVVPPPAEQSGIAAFLDRETGKIDALVAEQERLMALLKEKRQAVISQAVTKGLNTAKSTKDSGSKWLGEIPSHWRVGRIKHVVSHVVDCLHTTPHYDGKLEYPAVRTADIERGRLLLNQARLVCVEVYEERIERLRPIENDILYTREGERFGLAALVPPNVNLCLGQRMMMFRAAVHSDPGFLMWVLNSDAIYQQVLADLMGATAPHINISDIVEFHVPIPPLDEQKAISNHVRQQLAGCDELLSEIEITITLLRERRAALISAAVTGKIDVRSHVTPQSEAA